MDSNPVLDGVLKGVVSLIIFAAPIVMGLITKYVTDVLKAKKELTKAELTLQRFTQIASTLTTRMSEDLKPLITKAVADGRIDDAELKQIEEAALNELRWLWGEDNMRALADALNIPLGGLGEWVAQKVMEHMFGKYDTSAGYIVVGRSQNAQEMVKALDKDQPAAPEPPKVVPVEVREEPRPGDINGPEYWRPG